MSPMAAAFWNRNCDDQFNPNALEHKSRTCFYIYSNVSRALYAQKAWLTHAKSFVVRVSEASGCQCCICADFWNTIRPWYRFNRRLKSVWLQREDDGGSRWLSHSSSSHCRLWLCCSQWYLYCSFQWGLSLAWSFFSQCSAVTRCSLWQCSFSRLIG